ncbi:MAG: ATP-dependent DNA helicase RecG [Candidatus Geothermincolia bacterium]
MPEDNKRQLKNDGESQEKRAPSPAVEALNRFAAPVTFLPGVGPAGAKRLEPLGIATVADLLFHFPRRYLDRSNVTPIRDIKMGEEVTVVGRVYDSESRTTRSRKKMLVVTLFDGTGYLSGIWFNQEYHKDRLPVGTLAAFSGKVTFQYNMLQMTNPSFDVLGTEESDERVEGLHTGRIIPLYPATAGVTSAGLRKLVSRALEAVKGMADPVPPDVVKKFALPGLEAALRETHFPTGAEALKKSRYRLAFDELFTMQVGLALIKKRREREARGVANPGTGDLTGSFIESLPFTLTSSQQKAANEIATDMARHVQMNRLLQGEVGSGKTVVAVLALLRAVESGHQGAIMAPTEILAHQHFRRIGEMLEGIPVTIELLTGAPSRKALQAVESGEVDIVIGTHALVSEQVTFKDLGLAIIDEQHRFGLEQRVQLARKGTDPDILHMSATPIPRTLSLTLFGDLDVSVIDELPAGRKGVITHVAGPDEREGIFAMVGNEVAMGRQVFVICPIIEESPHLEARAAADEAEHIRGEFPASRVELVHGQMKGQDKRDIMERFSAGGIDILISTVMVEVGVDVPNATVMIVENADRFGLAQLHQLRGRIGRGTERAICVFFADPTTEEGLARMEAIKRYSDGFALAEADLAIRGEGSLFGTRQSGLPDLKVARLSRNFELIKKARAEAFRIVDSDPVLSRPEHVLLRWETNRRFGGSLNWLFHA